MKNCWAVRLGEIGRGPRRRQIRLALLRLNGNTTQLPVVEGDAVLSHGVTHLRQVIGANPVTQASQSTVDEHNNLIWLRLHGRGCLRIVNPLDVLNLEEMIATANHPKLQRSAIPGTLGDLPRIRFRQTAALFCEFSICGFSESLLDYPCCALR